MNNDAIAGRILIVDDDTALLEALPRALKLRLDGLQIDISDNAADATDLSARAEVAARRAAADWITWLQRQVAGS